MANKKDNSKPRFPKRLIDSVQNSLDKLYSSTMFTDPSNKHDLDGIKQKLDDSIDLLVASNVDNVGKGSLSNLYSRMQDFSNKDKTIGNKNSDGHSLEELLNDNAIMESGLIGFLNENHMLYDYDNKIDTIIKYMPKLQEALDTRRDNVLSADHFTKEYINVVNDSVSNNSASYDEHIKNVKEIYNFQEKAEEIYDNASKYGECFVYIVPYAKAVARLLRSKNNSASRGSMNLQELCIISENGKTNLGKLPEGITKKDLLDDNFGSEEIQIECNMSGMIDSVVEGYMKFEEASKSLNEMSLYSESSYEAFTEAAKDVRSALKGRFDKTIKDDLTFDGFDDGGIIQDGLIDKNKANKKKDNTINVPGSIFKILPRKNVIPLYIEDHCFGYYYIETEATHQTLEDLDRMQDPTMSLKGSNSILSSNSMTDQNQKQNKILKYLSNQIANFVDANFVNANQDLRNEIYMVLKYNQDNNLAHDKIRVTFIPPEDIEHVYFSKNKDTHRGISDLDKALFPATLWTSMYITNCIWTMTRSQDKRVYYVNSSVDTNISRVLLNTINQIKKGNMNIRQIENVNHILNITGKFNDYIIPRNSSGQAPVDFEVMQGQHIEFNNELMTLLEEMAVNSTDIPLELIQMRMSVEYATQYTMSSSKFLRKVYNRQAKYQGNLTRMFNRLYNNEYNDNISLTVKLPPPAFLNITNTNQMITNVNEYSQSVAQVMLDDNVDERVKNAVVREINKYNLGTYLNIPDLEEIVKRAMQEAAKNNNNNEEE